MPQINELRAVVAELATKVDSLVCSNKQPIQTTTTAAVNSKQNQQHNSQTSETVNVVEQQIEAKNESERRQHKANNIIVQGFTGNLSVETVREAVSAAFGSLHSEKATNTVAFDTSKITLVRTLTTNTDKAPPIRIVCDDARTKRFVLRNSSKILIGIDAPAGSYMTDDLTIMQRQTQTKAVIGLKVIREQNGGKDLRLRCVKGKYKVMQFVKDPNNDSKYTVSIFHDDPVLVGQNSDFSSTRINNAKSTSNVSVNCNNDNSSIVGDAGDE